MSSRHTSIALFTVLVALLCVSACKSDTAAGADQTQQAEATKTTPAETEAAQTEEEPEQIEEDKAEQAEGEAAPEGDATFGSLVEGATNVVVSQQRDDGEVDFGGDPRTVEDEQWIQDFVEAIGAEQIGSDAVPKCLPTYTLVFSDADQKLAEFGGVCAGDETVILVRDGLAYSAEDNAAALEMIHGLAN